MTRIIWSRRELERGEASNDGTLCFRTLRSLAESRADASFAQLFRRHYPAIRRLLDGRAEKGLALLVVGPNGADASGWFAARDQAVNALIIGRHGCADVFLPEDPRISLRHLALLLHRREAGSAVTFRVLDLRTPLAFADEERSRLEALEASGPVLLWCGALGLLLFPTGDGDPSWPEDPEVAWSRVPERLYVEKVPARPPHDPAVASRVRPLPREDPHPGSVTLVNTFAGPVFPTPEAAESDPVRGELRVGSAGGRVALRLGARTARRGLLLGRYDRCDTAGLPILTDPALSRVHLLVLELDGVLYGIDTASRNGSWCGGGRARVTRLLPGQRLFLADRAAVEWRPFH